MNLLLLNFDFPPNPGIGGRRWAKLSKALAQQGHTIHVVKARYLRKQQPSTWHSDVESPSINVHEVDCAYPASLLDSTPSLVGKIRYRIDQFILKQSERGTIYDKSIGWDKELMPLCSRLISEAKIDVIIATGAPWNLLVYAARLKQNFPFCKLLVDYRDPWLTAVNYGMQGLSASRMKAETDKQSFVFRYADCVTTPYTYLTHELENWCIQHCEKRPRFDTVEHFFDPDDFRAIHSDTSTKEEIRVVYAGDVYIKSETQWNWLKQIIDQHSASLSLLGKKLRFDFYITAAMPECMLGIPNVHVHEPIGKGIYSVLAKADVLLVVLPDNKKNERTTKFFEYLPYRKPIFVVADIGEVTDFVEHHHLGVHIHAPSNQIVDLLSGKFYQDRFNSEFDIETCTSGERASQITKLLA
jgi:glycosyltransferase involved in cell wall biosynthesis